MINNLISKAVSRWYDKQIEAERIQREKDEALMAKTQYLSSHPDSVFYVKPF
jgi:hypothetical protein